MIFNITTRVVVRGQDRLCTYPKVIKGWKASCTVAYMLFITVINTAVS